MELFSIQPVTNLEITLSFLIEPFSYMAKSQDKKCTYLENENYF